MGYTTQAAQTVPADESTLTNTDHDIDLGGRKDHSISFDLGSLTAGTLTMTVKLVGSSFFEDLVDDTDTQVVVDLAAPKSFSITNKAVQTLRMTVAGVAGSGPLKVTPSGD